MTNKVVFTNSIPSNLMKWLETYSKLKKMTKSAIIETALIEYREAAKKREMVEGFKRAAKDPEMLMLAEAGLDDYLEELKKWE